MAEVITLAGVRLDSRGVVEGVDKSNQALKKGEDGVKKFAVQTKASDGAAASFVRSLFDMKGALISVAGALGLTFILGAVAIGLKNLVSRVLENNEAWQTFKTRVGDVFRQFVLNEGLVDRVQRKMQEIAAGAGIEAPFSPERVQRLVKARETLQAELKEVGVSIEQGPLQVTTDWLNVAALGIGRFGNLMETTRLEGEQNVLALQGSSVLLQEQLRLVNLELSQMLEEFIKLDGTAAEFQAMTEGFLPARLPAAAQKRLADFPEPIGPEPFDPFAAAGIPRPEQIEEALGVAARAKSELDVLRMQGVISIDQFAAGVDNLKTGLISMGATAEEIFAAIQRTVAEFGDEGPKQFDKVGAATDLLTKGFVMLAQAAVQALFEGGVNAKKALANILKTIAAESLVRAVFEIAQGFAKAARFDPTSTLHFTAAKFFFKTAALAAAGAIAVGGRGGGREGGRGGGGAAFGGERQPERAGANVTVIIQGSQIGTDKDQLARDLAELIDTAREDGS